MGVLYKAYTDSLGTATQDGAVAIYENGKIYRAADGFLGSSSKGELIGEYENGFVYTVSSSYSHRRDYCVGAYGNEKVCRVSSGIGGSVVTAGIAATYSSGKIYRSNGVMQYSDVIGMYDGDGDGAGAAAAIVLLQLSSGVHASVTHSDTGSQSESGYSGGYSSGSSGSGGGVPKLGCSGFSLWWLFIIAIVCVAISSFWKNHPVISCVIVSVVVSAIVGFLILRKAKSKLLIAVIAFAVSMVALFNIADMSNRYNSKRYSIHMNGERLIIEKNGERYGRGLGVYKNWKGDMYCFADHIKEFCKGIVAVNVSIIPEEKDEALFFNLGNPSEEKRAIITLHNQNTGEQRQFYGYFAEYTIDKPELSYVPLKEVADWLGFDVKLIFKGIDFSNKSE